MQHAHIARSALTGLVVSFAATVGVAQQAAEAGAVVEYEFRAPLLNAQGVRSLADLRGAPVVIEFWGTR